MDREFRRKLLAEIVKKIRSGKFNSSSISLDELLPLHTSVRQEYQSPASRDTNDYGFMNVWEMDANEKEF